MIVSLCGCVCGCVYACGGEVFDSDKNQKGHSSLLHSSWEHLGLFCSAKFIFTPPKSGLNT